MRAMIALAQNRHPAVREYALNTLKNDKGNSSGIALLAMNYQPGDHCLIEGNYSTRSDQAFPGDGGLNGLEG